MTLEDIGEQLQFTALYRLYKFHRTCSSSVTEAVSDNYLPRISKSNHVDALVLHLPRLTLTAPPPYAVRGRGEVDGARDTLMEAWARGGQIRPPASHASHACRRTRSRCGSHSAPRTIFAC